MEVVAINIYKYRRWFVKGVKIILLITHVILPTLKATFENFEPKNLMRLSVLFQVADMNTHYNTIVQKNLGQYFILIQTPFWVYQW